MRRSPILGPRPTLELRQIAGSACALRVCAARSVWPCTNILGAVDLSPRSVADRVFYTVADRQLPGAPSTRTAGLPGLSSSETCHRRAPSPSPWRRPRRFRSCACSSRRRATRFAWHVDAASERVGQGLLAGGDREGRGAVIGREQGPMMSDVGYMNTVGERPPGNESPTMFRSSVDYVSDAAPSGPVVGRYGRSSPLIVRPIQHSRGPPPEVRQCLIQNLVARGAGRSPVLGTKFELHVNRCVVVPELVDDRLVLKISGCHQPTEVVQQLPHIQLSGAKVIHGLSHPRPDPTLMLVHAISMTWLDDVPSGRSALPVRCRLIVGEVRPAVSACHTVGSRAVHPSIAVSHRAPKGRVR